MNKNDEFVSEKSQSATGGIKIKSCPFCGSDVLIHTSASNLSYFISCSNDNCGCNYGYAGYDTVNEDQGFYENRDELIKAWNTRK